MKYRMMMMAALACAPLATACSTTDAETGDAQFNTSLIEDGVYTIGDGEQDDLDVAGSQIYAIDGDGRTALEIFDITTRELKATIPANPDFPPIEMEELDEDFDNYVFRPRFEMQGVQVDDGSEIIVWGVRDEHFTLSDMGIGPLPPQRNSFVVQGLSADGETVNWSLALDLRGADRSFHIQSLSAFVKDGLIAITHSQLNGLSFVATIPVPDGHQTLQFVEKAGVDMPVAEFVEVENIETPRGIGSGPDGTFLVASSDGVSTLDNGLTELASMSFANDFYLMDVRTVGERAYAADLYGYLHVISLADGSVLNSVELSVEGRSIDIEGNKIIIADTEAFQVLDINNLPVPEPTPIEEEEEEEEPEEEDDVTCGWQWVSTGWWGSWQWVCE